MRNIFSDYGKRSDGGVFADVAEAATRGQRMNPRLGPRRLIKQRQGAGEIQIGVGRNELRRGQVLDRCGNQDRPGAGVLDLWAYLGLARNVSLVEGSVLHAGNAGDFEAEPSPLSSHPRVPRRVRKVSFL